jgi:exopolysaccharide production protein ExoQ
LGLPAVLGCRSGGEAESVIAMMFVLVTALGSKLTMSLRFSLVALLLATITVIVVGFLVIPPDLLGEALRSVGKSSDLTGRTILWAQARLEMEQHPWLGIGFAAYWHPEFYDALGLYRALGIDAMTGFHFHNLFYESAVELGYVGVLVMAITLLTITGKGLARFVTDPSISSSFTLGVMTLLLSRVYLEVDFLSPFSEGTFLVTRCYAFLKPDRVALGSRAKPSFRTDDLLKFRDDEMREETATSR